MILRDRQGPLRVVRFSREKGGRARLNPAPTEALKKSLSVNQLRGSLWSERSRQAPPGLQIPDSCHLRQRDFKHSHDVVALQDIFQAIVGDSQDDQPATKRFQGQLRRRPLHRYDCKGRGPVDCRQGAGDYLQTRRGLVVPCSLLPPIGAPQDHEASGMEALWHPKAWTFLAGGRLAEKC